MSNGYPSPWNFSNEDKNLISPDGKYKVQYGYLAEIAMGGPIGADCFLIYPKNQKLRLNNWCGGPAVWQDTGKKVALPVWTANREQQIAVADVDKKILTIYTKLFRVLDLRTFKENIITGFDSPIHRTTAVEFNIDTEEINETWKLK